MIGKPKSSVSVAQKRAKALFTAETKENVSVPSGSDFALTPKGAWGAALIVEEKKRPKSHAVSKRASPRKQGQWAGADSPAVRQFGWDHEHTLLDEWNLAFNGSWPLQLCGKVFNNAGPGLEDGDMVEYTSQIISFKGRVAITKSGTKYYLGTPSPLFEAIRLQLCRATAAAERGPAKAAAISDSFFPFNPEHPFSFIDLGPTVPCSSVKLPAVAGWSANSNVALLHLWTIVKNASGYNACVGTVFNCPGAYDGTKAYTTGDVVEVKGRVMRTVDGRGFYLGRRAQGETSTCVPPLDEEAEFGAVDDLLSV